MTEEPHWLIFVDGLDYPVAIYHGDSTIDEGLRGRVIATLDAAGVHWERAKMVHSTTATVYSFPREGE